MEVRDEGAGLDDKYLVVLNWVTDRLIISYHSSKKVRGGAAFKDTWVRI